MNKLATILLVVLSTALSAQYEIKIHTKNLEDSVLIVSYPHGKRPEIIDTIKGDTSGLFIFRGDKDLATGVYYIGRIRNKQLYRLIIKPYEDKFDVFYDFRRTNRIKVDGSDENKIYADYLRAIENHKLRANLLTRGNHKHELDSIHRIINNKRLAIIKDNPGTIVSLLIKSEIDWVDPYFNGLAGKELEDKILDFKIKHYLDNLVLSDSITFRLPGTHREIIKYFDKYVHLKPEIVNSTIDSVLEKMGFKSEMYKYYLPFFLNRYNRSYKSWFDNVYVHIARTYYTEEKAPWIPPNTLDFVQYKADNKEKTLVGKTLPDITFVTEKGDSVLMSNINAKYLVLVIWRPGCSHCRHAMPILNDLRKKYGKEGVKIATICTRQRSDTYRCWNGVKKEKMEGFLYNLADKGGKTNFLQKYNVGGVPMIYILDKNKRILDKNVKSKHIIERVGEIINSYN